VFDVADAERSRFRLMRSDEVSTAVVAIHLGEEANPELWSVASVRAVAGKGLEGDRHFHRAGAPSRAAISRS
jgi:hypothetical protein